MIRKAALLRLSSLTPLARDKKPRSRSFFLNYRVANEEDKGALRGFFLLRARALAFLCY